MLTWARRMNYSAGLQIGNQSPKDGIKKFRITKETGTFLLSNHSSSRLWKLLHLSLDLAFKPQEITGELEAKLIWWHRKLGQQSWMKTLSMDSNCRSQGHSSPKGSSLTQVSQGITNLWLPNQEWISGGSCCWTVRMNEWIVKVNYEIKVCFNQEHTSPECSSLSLRF